MTAQPYTVQLTLGGQRDLRSIYAYVASDQSALHADALIDRLMEKVESLKEFPERGKMPAELAASGHANYR